jgi:hypothetical protein
MQKSLSELASLPPNELTDLLGGRREPLLVTRDGEPQFIAQSLDTFDEMVRRLRFLEARQNDSRRRPITHETNGPSKPASSKGKVIPIRR